MKRNLGIAVLVLVMVVALYSFDAAFGYTTNAVFSVTGNAVAGPQDSSVVRCDTKAEPGKVICPSGVPKRVYEPAEYGDCLAWCDAGSSTAIPSRPPADSTPACSSKGQVPGSGQACCSGLTQCQFCGGECHAACPNAQCQAPDGVSCSDANQCQSNVCDNNACGGKQTSSKVCQPNSDGRIYCASKDREYPPSEYGDCISSCLPGDVPPDSGKGGSNQEGRTPPPATGGADLVVKVTEAPSRVFKGGEYSVKVRITNIGDESTASHQKINEPGFVTSLSVLLQGTGPAISGEHFTNELRAGEYVDKTFSWTVPDDIAEGTYNYNAMADKADRIKETNEENNAHDDKVVEISSRVSSDGVDLRISIDGVANADGVEVSELITGNQYKITLTNENVGNIELPFASFFSVLYFGEERIASKRFGYSEFADDQKEEWSVSWKVPDTIQTGEYYLTARIDTQNSIVEIDEDNNVQSPARTISIIKRTEPNLAVENSAAVPGSGNAFNAVVKIANRGDIDVDMRGRLTTRRGSVSNGFISVGAKVKKREDVVCTGSERAGQILAGLETRDLIIELKKMGGGDCVLESGNYVLEVTVDDVDWLIEPNEDDNKDITLFNVGSARSFKCPGSSGDVSVGFRGNDASGNKVYCSPDGQLSLQKETGALCKDGFECLGNVCAAGRCVDELDLERALCQLKIISC